MSEFFYVSLQKDVILDDSQIKNNMTWSSKKIRKEIINTRITKFEELQDVDVTNKKNKQLVAYSSETGKFTTIDRETISEITGSGLKQVTKMGIMGSPDNPHITKIPINTVDFKVPKVNVLQYKQGKKNLVTTENSFDNGDCADFIENQYIEFDGKAHLKTKNIIKFNDLKKDDKYECVITKFKIDDFKVVNQLDDKGDSIEIKGVPVNQILIPKGDKNLSNVDSIKDFKLSAEGKKVKVIVSNDSGISWFTFKEQKWIPIDFNVKALELDGISVNQFNRIDSESWDLLNKNKKIRFAYLLYHEENDIANIDDLKMQYDGLGYWQELKESDYDVVYASNTMLEVHLRVNGDIKINY